MSGKIQCTRHNSHKVFNVRHTLFNHKRSISGPVMCFRSDLVCTQPQCCVTGLFRHIYCAVVPTCSSMPVRHHNYWSGTKPVNMLLVLKCGLQKPAVVCSQSHSCVLTSPRAQNCQPNNSSETISDALQLTWGVLRFTQTRQTIPDRATKQMHSSVHLQWILEKSIPVAQTAERWQHQGHGFDSQGMYELIKCTPLMQYKPLGIKGTNKCINETKSCLWTNTHQNSAVDFHRNHCTDWNPCFWSSSQFSV